ncbi:MULTISPECIES: GNAT family N-acetyltransferase [Marinomonas]|uniref:Acetyltransferase n=1 Tax=Marinomonas arctica TaxID=383750 RepID=A0A7H1J6Q7_9GAMM|nr:MULTISPECIES: GNAT family N-acetyltransferase [Marinomonas]MCS7485147.1 siderophore biosynthesis protein [Marinomonas sp. BSi20414]QNT06173.1 acetyltransferase [Marinomonas arctica]GGN18230.1 hydroxylysine acetyltransferase [Marinomonas arctica]
MTGNPTSLDHTLPVGQCVSLKENTYHVTLSSGSLSVQKEPNGQGILNICDLKGDELLRGLALLFESSPQLRSIALNDLFDESLNDIVYANEDGRKIVWRETLMQYPQFWLTHTRPLLPHKAVLSKSGYHPMRPQPQSGELYRRHIPALRQEISLVGLDIEQHADLFSKWQNSDRVAAFWDQKGSLEEHTAYLKEQLADNKNQLLIVCLDDEPFAYIEAYWAKEDRIAPYYSVGDYDRGIHMLVGEEHHRGAHKVAAWLPSVCHYLYLADPRTDKVVSEPRADNQKMIDYLQKHGFAKLKEFDFPHKRSALMSQLRESFFTDCF